MSQEKVEMVRTVYDMINSFMRGELSDRDAERAAREIVDPLCEFGWGQEIWPEQPPHLRGFPQLLGWWTMVGRTFAEVAIEPLEFIEGEDRVVVSLSERGRERATDGFFETHFFQVWTIRDGKVHDVASFQRHADALEAAGL